MEEFIKANISNVLFAKIVYIIFKISLIVLVTFIADKSFTWIIDRFINYERFKTENKIKTISVVTHGLIKAVLYLTAIINILVVFNVNIGSVIALASVASIGIGLAVQGLLRDFITGVFILLEEQFNLGDLVTINGLTGRVENITMRITKIRSMNGDLHIIPNGEIKIVTSKSKEFTRAIVEVNVDYEENTQKIIEILEDEMQKCKLQYEDFIEVPQVEGITEIKGNIVTIRIVATCKASTHYSLERELKLRIKQRFELENIKIPILKSEVNICNMK